MLLPGAVRPARLALLAALAACGHASDASLASAGDVGAPAAGSAAPGSVRLLPVPPDSTIPPGALGRAIRRGRAVLESTGDSLPANVGNRLRCLSCHLDAGRRENGSPLVGVYAGYPAYVARSGRVISIEDRVNGCFERSMDGRALAAESGDMRDIVAYLAFISRGTPVGSSVTGRGLPRLPPLAPHTERGRAIFASTCARCHGRDGQGTTLAPPLWGPASFNIGAGMARLHTAASFIRHNMPYDRPGTLTNQAAFDVAAWVVSRPRPDFAGKENDWPHGDAPPDAAYPTRASPVKDRAGATSR